MKRNFPEVFQRSNVRQIIDYPDKFMKILNDLSPVEKFSTTAILTPGSSTQLISNMLFWLSKWELCWLRDKI